MIRLLLTALNPELTHLQPYPFEKLRTLFSNIEKKTDLPAIRLSIGEPQHPTPSFIRETVAANLDGLAHYPTTQGSDALRESIAAWLMRRYALPNINPATQVLPVNGSREALFSFAQCVLDGHKPDAKVLCPNPFYQIYEGATFLAGASPVFLNHTVENRFGNHFDQLPPSIWNEIQLVFICSPDNPTGAVLSLEEWKQLFELSERYNFIIAADECYSEIYFNDNNPPIGALEAAHHLGCHDFKRLVVFSSLSKRSNVPGMRSGFVAGDAAILKTFLRYRTYHGCAMSPTVQTASIAAWNDEKHVIENRRLYKEKFNHVMPILSPWLAFEQPDASFYLWAQTPISDTTFARNLQEEYNVTVLPGSFLAREANGINPGKNFIRIALVADIVECIEAAQRIANYCQQG